MQNIQAVSRSSDAQVSFDRLKKIYVTDDDDLLALNETSFSIGKGEFVSVLGPSGCGKSTLLLMAAGLESSSGGTVTIGGQVVEKPYTDIGIVFQEHALYEWRTILQNIMLQAEIRRLSKSKIESRAYELLEQTGLKEFAHKYPSELSGGMRQRAAICRALVHDPSVLFFDEPFGALDALTREQMRIDLEKMWLEQRPTVLFITHGISEAVALSDRIIVMTPRPGQVDEVLAIDLPRPRTKEVLSSQKFIDYCDRITESFMRRGIIKY
ncbi:ABC transporter ATP-binding protein [Paraburkholderia sp. Ac-20336]|uniref:ABC transporter ATP-binding protein n=1 Tax=Paraburkholderia sp. Ac-20336 TaxID=2703886 RepID=UPI0019813393|nr:ABC transporter ATP-binding protein [Paraburkholderia sp. Ac-20336]MBN3801925.1 ABC transporter ATP-binding protein [Paraburkholderia sp. Ac-20336]